MPDLAHGVVFDLRGPMAHFRKYYTNSSSLTYAFPPRTTLAGIVAAMMGVERDGYYELLQPPNCYFALEILEPVRTVIFTVNYLPTDETETVARKFIEMVKTWQPRTQIPVEIALPAQKGKWLCYRVYLWHSDSRFLEDLEKRLMEGRFVYPPALGISELLCSVSFVGRVGSASEFRGDAEVSSVVNTELATVNLEKLGEIRLFNEKMPLYMRRIDKGRELAAPPANFIYGLRHDNGIPVSSPLPLEVKAGGVKVDGKHLVLMEDELRMS